MKAINLLLLTFLLLLFTSTYSQLTTILNSGCKTLSLDGRSCLTCASRFYKDGTGVCQPVSSSCNTYNQNNGACTSCYSGYMLLETKCFLGKNSTSTLNPYCSKFNGTSCVQCSKGYYLNNNNECLLIDPLCKNYNLSSKKCVECFDGYQLKPDGSCLIKPLIVATGGCAQLKNNICIRCSKGYYFDAIKQCVGIDPFCKTFDYEKSICKGCFVGFQLKSNQCVMQGDEQNCKQFNPADGSCISCSTGYYLDVSICVKIDVYCKKFDFTSLQCTECYGGYTLKQFKCINTNSIANEVSGFEYCAQWLEGVCVKCVERAYIDFQGNCQGVNPACKTFDIFSGECTSCYGGVTLNKNGTCTIDDNNLQSNCAQYDVKAKLCIKCYNGSFLNINFQCQQTDKHCQTFNQKTLVCDQCYRGYSPNPNGICLQLPPSISIQNCVQINLLGKCIRCFNLYYLSSSDNTCKQVNPLCKTFNQTNGKCLSCFNGFTLDSLNGECNYD